MKMEAYEEELYKHVVSKHWKKIVAKFEGRNVMEAKDEIIDYLDSIATDSETEDALRILLGLEPTRVRLSTLHKVLEKRENETPYVGYYYSGSSDNNFWLGVVYGSYVRKVLSLDETISLLMELHANGLDTETYQIIAEELLTTKRKQQEEEKN